MAIVFGEAGFRVVDFTGEVTSIPAYWNASDTVTLAQLNTDLATLGTDIGNVIGGEVTQGLAKVVISGITATSPVAPETIEQMGLLRFLSSDGYERTYSLGIPSMLNAKFLTNSKKINTADTGITALATLLTGGGAHLAFNTSTGKVIASLESGQMVFHKHRRIAARH